MCLYSVVITEDGAIHLHLHHVILVVLKNTNNILCTTPMNFYLYINRRSS